MARATSNPMENADFEEELRQALSHVNEPDWLERNSPLATPYFLGGADAGTPGARLGARLMAVADDLWDGELPGNRESILEEVNAEREREGKGARYSWLVLELHFFRRFFRIGALRLIWEDYLFIGKSQYYRDLDGAIRLLAVRLLDALQPAFSLERPRPPARLVGRDPEVDEARTRLARGESLMLSGPGGSGKSTLAATLAAEWDPERVFWFTIRAGFNDQFDGLLFGLALFLQRLGKKNLWRQLIAGGGRITDETLALALLRADLEALAPDLPLLCLDELDLLRPPEREQERPAHTRLLELVAGLRGHAPLLLIGQRPVLEADGYLELGGLSRPATRALAAELEIELEPATLTRLQRYTGGNPRLLLLCLALAAETGRPLDALLDDLPRAPVLEVLVARLRDRLGVAEREVLERLSIFRAPAPRDAWPDAQAAIGHLERRRLVISDEREGIAPLPVIRDLVARELAPERREALHLSAAAIRARRGAYTAASYHLWRADNPTAAIALWYPRREAEILRGQAPAARAIFREISARRLEPPARERLALLRARLDELAGEPRRALDELDTERWVEPSPTAVEAALLGARLTEGLGDPGRALDRYESGLAATAELLRQRIRLRVGRGTVQVRQKQLEQATREALLARFEAEQLEGVVREAEGDYAAATRHFEAALELAERAADATAAARAHHHLAGLAGRRDDTPTAAAHLEAAMASYERVGDRFTSECVRCNLSALALQQRDFARAADHAARALAFFERVSQPYWIAIAATNLAEARVEQGQLDAAEAAALRAMEQEEPHSQPYALFTLGAVARERGHAERAIARFGEAATLGARNGDRYLEAFARRDLGALHRAHDDEPAARRELETALTLFDQLGMTREAERTHAMLDP